MRKCFARFDERFFRLGSPVALALFRILVGVLALAHLLLLAGQFEELFTERGYTPVSHATRWAGGLWRLNLLSGVRDERVTATFFVLVVIAAFLVAMGLFTRPATIALFVGLVTLHHRSPDTLSSADTLLRQWAFVLMISPCARAWSVDRLIRLRRGAASVEFAPISIWPERLVQCQLAVMYFATVWHKLGGKHWLDGTAVWYALSITELQRFPVPDFLLAQPFLALATWGTLAVEVAMASLVFIRPLRPWVLLAGVVLHLSIEYSMNIPLFAFVVLSGYVCFLDGERIESAWRRITTPGPRLPGAGRQWSA